MVSGIDDNVRLIKFMVCYIWCYCEIECDIVLMLFYNELFLLLFIFFEYWMFY